MIDLNKTLVVIGGSRGIGAAVVRLASAMGYRIAFGYRDQKAAADSLVQEATLNGWNVKAFALDIGDMASVNAFFDQVKTSCGVPDALAQCAGISGPRGKLIDMDPRDIAGLLTTNLTGTFYCVHAAAKMMAISRGGKGGAIVALSSEAARFGGNQISPYAASKAGINAMVTGVARELAAENIRLNAVSPGAIDTSIASGNSAAPPHSAVSISSIPAGRMGRPEEVAHAVLWLLSDEAAYITGTTLSVAGGR